MKRRCEVLQKKKLTQYQGKGNCQYPFYPNEEAKLRDIIIARRANNEPCGGEFIRSTMMKLVAESGRKGRGFNASHNWLTRFSSRMNVPNRKGPIPGTLKMNKFNQLPQNSDDKQGTVSYEGGAVVGGLSKGEMSHEALILQDEYLGESGERHLSISSDSSEDDEPIR